MPASDTVPSPLKFLGRIPGTPGELTYAKDIYRYYEALAKASPRAKFWKIGQTEEGRDQVSWRSPTRPPSRTSTSTRTCSRKLGDPRKTTDEQARELIKTGKPIYWANSGIHSPETGGPEMLIELAYRLIVEETPFIQTIRNNVDHVHHAGDRSRRPREAGRHLLLRQEDRQAAPAADVLGQVRAARQQSRRHGPVPEADARTSPRPCSSGTPPSCTICTRRSRISMSPPAPARTTTRSIRSPIDEWWLLGRDRSDGDDQARRARRLDLRLLRRLGAELPVLDRASRTTPSAASTKCRATVRTSIDNLRSRPTADQPRVVPPESAAALHQVGTAQQHQHPGIGAAVRAEPGGQRTRAVPRELLAEEQARDREGQERPDLRLGDSRRRSAARPTPPTW